MHKHSAHAIAIAATLHCLTGCAIGEITGMVLGELFGLSNTVTIALSIALAFFFGYSLSALPLVRGGASFGAALKTVFAADTVSILTMEIVDNAFMYAIPGAMGAGLVNPLFWVSMAGSLFVAFWAAYPINRYMISRGKGHAVIHAQHEHGDHDHASHHREHEHHDAHSETHHQCDNCTPHDTRPAAHAEHSMDNHSLLYSIVAFLAGGLLVALAATTFDRAEVLQLDSHPAAHDSRQ